MKSIGFRRLVAVALAAGSLGAAALAVDGWTQVGPTGFQLPNANPIPIWSGPKTTRVGTSVRTTTGKVKVWCYDVPYNPNDLSNPAPVYTAIVPQNRTVTLEGNYENVVLSNFPGILSSTGSYVNSTDDGLVSNRLVGEGSVQCPSTGAGAAYTFWGTADPAIPRTAVVQAGSGSATVYQSGLTLEAGDWGFVSATTSTFDFVTTYANPSYKVLSYVHMSGQAYTGTAKAQGAGDVDRVAVDGGQVMRVTLKNTNESGDVFLTSCVNGTLTTVPVPPGQTVVADGVLNVFSWTYTADQQTVEIKLE